VTVSDPEGQVLLQGTDQLVSTGQPGVFRLHENELGRGEYVVTVKPATALAENYQWRDADWGATANGRIDPLFYGVVAGSVAAAAALGALVVGQVRVRQHPLSGMVSVYEKKPNFNAEAGDLAYIERPLTSQQLPKRNKFNFRLGHAGNIRSIRLSSPNQQAADSRIAQAEVRLKGRKDPFRATLSPGTEVQIPATDIYVAKDRRPGGVTAGSTGELKDTFQ